ncbi:MAG: ASCH domain-containing protein [Bifidobacterium psychraerophilum]|uniref:ASCH domain-containing protein n=1 Tax=Bifidobacterium psychraerophilum TaxID=218140 RepID=UPI0039ED5D96
MTTGRDHNIDIDALTPEEMARIPKDEFAYPGPVRDALVASILEGRKTSTACLHREFGILNEEIPKAGDLSMLIDSHDHDLAILRYTSIENRRFIDVDDRHAIDEGEGYTDAAGWRKVHADFWNSPEYREEFGEEFTIDDDTLVTLERFEVARLL